MSCLPARRGAAVSPASRAARPLLAFAALAAACLCAGETGAQSGKKFIQVGWDIPTTQFLRQHWQEMERGAPFDGVVFKVVAKAEGKACDSQQFWQRVRWKREWFQEAVADLKSCQFRRLTSNLLSINATPGDVDWSDDEGWQNVAHNAGLMAWLVKEGGCRGFFLDFEHYGHPMFRFDAAKQHTFEQTSAIARKRGAQFMQAVAAEYPDATTIAAWLNSINLNAGAQPAPEAILAIEGYGLLPAFINGLLDALPPAMTLVDGCEEGYYMDSDTEYLSAAGQMRQWLGGAARLVAPENRAKYRAQVQAGFGFYLDMYLNEEGNRYYFGPRNGSRLARLLENLKVAREAADEYVWVYGEQCRWWPGDFTGWTKQQVAKAVGKGRLWEEAMPGITAAIAWVRDPLQAARAEIAEQQRKGAFVNLARNPSCDTGGKAAPADYSVWQNDDSKGTFSWDPAIGCAAPGSAKAAKVKNGCFLQRLAVKPGETYCVEARSREQGSSVCTIRVRWQKENGQWTREHDDKTFVFSPDRNAWAQASGLVRVPPEVGQLVILLCVHNQLSDEDIAWFDDLKLYKVGAGVPPF